MRNSFSNHSANFSRCTQSFFVQFIKEILMILLGLLKLVFNCGKSKIFTMLNLPIQDRVLRVFIFYDSAKSFNLFARIIHRFGCSLFHTKGFDILFPSLYKFHASTPATKQYGGKKRVFQLHLSNPFTCAVSIRLHLNRNLSNIRALMWW